MKVFLIYFAFAFFLVTSCKKEREAVIVEDPQAHLLSLKDSVSFNLDGKKFERTYINTIEKSRNQITLDIASGRLSADSILYSSMFKFAGGERGQISFTFMKKFRKDQLITKTNFLLIEGPESEMDLYKTGEHPYAIDFATFNTYNGISIELLSPMDDTAGYEILTSSIPFWKRLQTTITPASQNNSRFEIISLQKLSNGNHLLEAKFSANLFNEQEKQRRLENGYLRMQISITDNK